MTRDLDELEAALHAQGIATDARVSSTLGRTHGSLALGAAPRISQFPEADAAEESDFTVLGELGRGGMATVWLAQQTALGREVALKRANEGSEPDTELLLLREAVITGQLEHPNIVPIHWVLVDERGPAVVMKRISGTSWESLLAARETPLDRHLDILLQVVNAVAFAHSKGVLHRDIKPANVMIGDFGEVYLVDWGVARRASDPPSDAIVGTPRYMAPEMAEGRADERTDVFLLGATLHEVLTGEPRHRGDSALLVLYAAMYVEPFAYGPDVPDELAAIANRACARAPEDRYENVRALRDALIASREHRAASALCEAAEERLAELERALASASYDDVQRLCNETRFGFDTALRGWPESARARTGRARCLRAMVDYELAAGRADAASALLAALGEHDEARSAALTALRDQQVRQRAHVEEIERDRDPAVGAQPRTQAYVALGVAVLAMTLALIVQRALFPEFRPSTLRLLAVGSFVLVVMIVIVLWWRRAGEFNFINRRIAEITVGTLAVSFANRLSGTIMHVPPEQVLVTDALLLGLGGACMAAYHRAGPYLAWVSFFVAIVGSIWPAWVDDLFIALTVFIASSLLLLRHTLPPTRARLHGRAERENRAT